MTTETPDKATRTKYWPSKAVVAALAVLAALFGGARLLRVSPRPPPTAEDTQPLTAPAQENASPAELMPFAVDYGPNGRQPDILGGGILKRSYVAYDPKDQTVQRMRRAALALARAMDNPRHLCNPLVTARTKITGIGIMPFVKGDKMYTLWLSDGVTTCGLNTFHSEGRRKEIFPGDFLRRFYLEDFVNGFAYNATLLKEVESPGKKPFSRADVGEAAHDMLLESCGEAFFENTLPQQYSGFSVSEGLNLTINFFSNESTLHYTKNAVIATLRRTDMPQANPYDPVMNSKVDVMVQAEPPGSPLAFKVVNIDVNNNGFDPRYYGNPNPNLQAKAPTAVRLR